MLKDPNTSINRFGLLGLLLEHCGKPEPHGKVLEQLIDDPKVKQASGLDGLLAGYILLNAKDGLEFVASLVKDTKKDSDSLRRFVADARRSLLAERDERGQLRRQQHRALRRWRGHKTSLPRASASRGDRPSGAHRGARFVRASDA